LSAQQPKQLAELGIKRSDAEVSKGGSTQAPQKRERSDSAHGQAGASPGKTEVPVADLLNLESLTETILETVTDPQQSTTVDLSSTNFEDQPLSALLSETFPPERPQEMEQEPREGESILLVNSEEQLMVQSADELVKRLGIDEKECVKVVSIFGNTGDGKSHTLNHAFFDGREVFSTSPRQSSCTIGVWCAYDPAHHTLFLDTEGLLGATSKHLERTRLLLKILAISDIVIYRTRADRLHNDMYTFLNNASDVYEKYFATELQAVGEKLKLDKPQLRQLGPVVVIFHETQHTELLGGVAPESPKSKSSHYSKANKMIQQGFAALGLSPKSFSAFHYVGTRTLQQPTDFSLLVKAVKRLVKDNSVRSPRPIEVILKSLEILNSKFSNSLQEIPFSFADEYFTCRQTCLACNTRCMETMNHEKDEKPHKPEGGKPCILKHEFENKIYYCEVRLYISSTVAIVKVVPMYRRATTVEKE
jgi:zinc finger FYVE domain-containing protein 1